jgi:flagellar biosynthesis chaperone FliJ
MNDIHEIKAKEKSLADLMSRVLKEPLNPIELSVNKLGCDFLELKDKVDEVEQALEHSAARIDKFGKALKILTQEQLPNLSQKNQEDIEGCFRKEIKTLTDTIDETRKHLTEQLDLRNDKFAEIVHTQQEIKLLFDNFEQSITAKNASHIEKITGNLSNAMQANREHAEVLITGLSNNANAQYEDTVRKLDDLSRQNQDDANKFLVTLNGIVNNQSTMSERISVENTALALAIQANREHAEVLITGLSNNANTQFEEIDRKLDGISTENQNDANKFLVTLNEVVNNQSTISERISVENTALALAIAASEKKLNIILMMLLALAGVVVTYIGYDIFLSK